MHQKDTSYRKASDPSQQSASAEEAQECAGDQADSPAILQPVPQQHKGHLFYELGSIWVDGPPGAGVQDAYLTGLMRKTAKEKAGLEAEADENPYFHEAPAPQVNAKPKAA